MPVTFKVANHPATGWNNVSRVSLAEELLKEACPKQYRRCERLIQTSFTSSQLGEGHVSASENGFVWAAYHAYSSHHHLRIRPEDIWFAILTQLSFFINANAEELRSFFVRHEGQKNLRVEDEWPDFGHMAKEMTHMIAKNVVDPELREWVMPAFTTTTDCDTVVGSILFMGAMQKYFTYTMGFTCGLPSVTLLGDVEDWKDILKRLDKLDLLGKEPALFAQMLRPILRRFILSCEDPTSAEVARFWNTIVDRHVMGSGTDYLSGWLTAFCFWDEDGEAKRQSQEILIDGVGYPIVFVDKVPSGFASVPVTVDDDGHVYQTTMVAGSVGILATVSSAPTPDGVSTSDACVHATNDGKQARTESPIHDTLQALSGWWMYEDEALKKAEEREAEKKRLREQIDELRSRRELVTGKTAVERREKYWEQMSPLVKRLEELEAH